MNFRQFSLILLFFFLMTFPGCSLIEGVFRLGIWFTILGFLLIITLLVLILRSVSYKPSGRSRISQK
ncbi:MAG: hypothetical protein WD317_05935 [Balneolaceae bacterium]